MTEPLNTHNLLIDFGRYKGERWTRVSTNYLLSLVRHSHPERALAEAELQRRGTAIPAFDVSNHAVDRASQDCADIWRRTAKKGEGIHSWLVRMATRALVEPPDAQGRHRYKGMKFAFDTDGAWPLLVTVIRHKTGPKRRDR
jgi:hypothetical protein